MLFPIWPARFDAVVAEGTVPRLLGRWVRLLLLRAGDVERNPGPRRQRPLEPRGELGAWRALGSDTARRRQFALDRFEVYLREAFGTDLRTLGGSGVLLAAALRAFIRQLFDEGSPQHLAKESVLAVSDLYEHWRSSFGPAWTLVWHWNDLEPGRCRPILPLAVLEAMLTLCCLWGWSCSSPGAGAAA